jgi:hypothetical protein
MFKNFVRTSKRVPHFTITKANWLTLFKIKTKPFTLIVRIVQIHKYKMQSCYSSWYMLLLTCMARDDVSELQPTTACCQSPRSGVLKLFSWHATICDLTYSVYHQQ